MQTADLREVTAQYFSVQHKFKNQKLLMPMRPLNTEAGRTGFTSCLLTQTPHSLRRQPRPRGDWGHRLGGGSGSGKGSVQTVPSNWELSPIPFGAPFSEGLSLRETVNFKGAVSSVAVEK